MCCRRRERAGKIWQVHRPGRSHRLQGRQARTRAGDVIDTDTSAWCYAADYGYAPPTPTGTHPPAGARQEQKCVEGVQSTVVYWQVRSLMKGTTHSCHIGMRVQCCQISLFKRSQKLGLYWQLTQLNIPNRKDAI